MSKKQSKKSALSIARGIQSPPAVNPNRKKIERKHLTVNQYVEGIIRGNRTVLSQAITLIESNLSQHIEKAQEIIKLCLPHAGKSIRVGITGIPGVGKSSFIEALGIQLTAENHRLAVLAIDPSSERSKGSILGDKTRMEILSASPNAFIRPSPSAGTLGGVARKTRESILLCEAAGFDIIFVETVGVGQSEIAVHSMVDFFLLLILAGAGDELQGIKRGIMEMADMLAITKADGVNEENAKRAAAEYASALHLFPPGDSGWIPEVHTCSAHRNKGIKELWKKILEYQKLTVKNGYFADRRKRQSLYWMDETIMESLKNRFYQDVKVHEMLERLKKDVLEDKVSSFVAAQQVMAYYFSK
jgi:LAO/AO transport system kinase